MPSLSLLLILLSLISLSSAHSTTLSLSPAAAPPSADPWERLRHLAAASAARAYQLKYPASTAAPLDRMQATSSDKIPLHPRGYGGYSVALPFGTPPQPLSFVMDTGSSLVWAPCTDRYSCSSCNFQGITNASVFLPRSSSSAMIIGCRNPKCRWIFPDVRCSNCSSSNSSSSCNEFCPPYVIEYGSGSTTGLLLSESLNLPEKVVRNFVFGCSVFASRLPEGIAGFGRGPEGLPAQMGLKRFSYCLVSHRFDDEPVSSELVLESGGRSRKQVGNSTSPGGATSYTPFRQNRTPSNPAFTNYYYLTLRRITVGGVKIKASYNLLVPDSAGNGGTIIDSGTTFTAMDNSIYNLVAEEFEKQVGKTYARAREIEARSGLRPCFDVSGRETITLPQLAFHFKGGAGMELPLGDYFSFVDDSVVCMTIVSSGPGKGPGPAVILGNYQQQDYYVEYDLENGRLGFRKQVCK